ncbi:LuxR family transcriptional regulator [Rugosimonospora acidiphila]|uniref:LuxR family transcriptional regulator n=1 Tax=Rugosimonospora acidiphila TaxID=556531 RepID=A0ABP9RMC4_9ACTN
MSEEPDEAPLTQPGVATRMDLVHQLERLRRRAARGRHKTRLSLDDIVKATGIPKSSLANYLSGRTLVPADQLDAILQALGATVPELSFCAQLWERIADQEHDAAGASPRPIPRTRPAEHPRTIASRLVGRNDQLTTLDTLVTALGRQQGQAILVEGPPGIGKSALMTAVIAAARDAGCATLRAACEELSRAFPLLPLLEALRQLQPDSPDWAVPAGTQQILAAHENPLAAAGERVVMAIERLCTQTPLLLVVDDLQWGDDMTISTLSRLVRLSQRRPILVLAAARPLPRRDDLDALRRTIGRDRIMTLRPLENRAVTELLRQLTGSHPGAALATLAARAAGNPFYLVELVGALDRAHALTTRAGTVELTDPATPLSLSRAIADRLAYLTPPTRSVLQHAALLGLEFQADELATAADLTVENLVSSLEEAIDGDVLVDNGRGLAFRHPLIRDVLYDAMAPTIRMIRHRAVAHALLRAAAPPERVARQLLPTVTDAAAVPHPDSWVRRWLVDSGHRLVERAPRAAVPLLRWALTEPVSHDEHGPLAGRLADALLRTGDPSEAARVASEALARGVTPGELVALQWTLAASRSTIGHADQALAEVEQTLRDHELGPREQARLLVMAARVYRSLGRITEAGRTAQDALAAAQAAGDSWSIAWALAVVALVRAHLAEPTPALALVEQALTATAEAATLNDLRLLLHINKGMLLNSLDHHDTAIASIRQARRLARSSGNVLRLVQTQAALVEVCFDYGRWDDALAAVRSLDDIEATKDPTAECISHAAAALIALHRGTPHAHRHLAQARSCATRVGPHRIFSPYALATSLQREQSQDLAGALAVLLEALANGTDELDEAVELMPDVVRLAIAGGDEATALATADHARKTFADATSPHHRAAAPHCRGLFARDASLLLQAAELYRAADRPLPRAQAMEAAGIVALDAGNRSAAGEHFAVAKRTYDELGCAWDISRITSYR